MGVYLDEDQSVVVPAEVCTVLPGQRYNRQMNKDQQTIALRTMTQTPAIRWPNIGKGMKVCLRCRELARALLDVPLSSSTIVTPPTSFKQA